MDRWAGLFSAELSTAELFSATHARAADTDREKLRYICDVTSKALVLS